MKSVTPWSPNSTFLIAFVLVILFSSPTGGVSPAATELDFENFETGFELVTGSWLQEVAADLPLPEEWRLYQSLYSPDDRGYFRGVFWARRDPTPDTVHNEFKYAYLGRKQRARELFSCRLAKTAGDEEGADRMAVPGDLTDMGRIYTLLGQPDGGLRDTFKPGANAETLASARFATNFEWIYSKSSVLLPLAESLNLSFEDKNGDGVPELVDEARFFGDIVPELRRKTILWPDIFYQPGGRPLDGRPMDMVDEIELVASVREYLRYGMGPVNMDVQIRPQISFFRGEQGKSTVWLNCGLYVVRGQGHAAFRVKKNQGAENLRLRGLVVGPDGDVADRFHIRALRIGPDQTMVLSETVSPADEPWSLRRVFDLAPGDYQLYLIASDRATSKQGWHRISFRVPDLGLDQLAASSLLLGNGLEPYPLTRRPMPPPFCNRGQQLTPLPPYGTVPLLPSAGPTLLYHVYLPADAVREGGSNRLADPRRVEASFRELTERPFLTTYRFKRSGKTVLTLPGSELDELARPMDAAEREWKVSLTVPPDVLSAGEYEVEVEVILPGVYQTCLLGASLAITELDTALVNADSGETTPLRLLTRLEGRGLAAGAGVSDTEREVVITTPTAQENIFAVKHLEAVPTLGPNGEEADWIDFYVDGEHLLRDLAPPYRCLWRAYPSADNYQVAVRAHYPGEKWGEDRLTLVRPENFISLEVELQQMYVTVVDPQTGEYAAGLDRDDFRLLEDGIEQEISHFEQKQRQNMAVAFLFDLGIDPPQALQKLKDGAVKYLSEHFPRDDRAFIAGYRVKTVVQQELTSQRGLLASAVKSLPSPDAFSSKRADRMMEAISACAAELEQLQGDRKVLVLLSDGKDVTAAISNRGLADQLQRSGITLYAIGINTTPPLTDNQFYYLTRDPSNWEKAMRLIGLGGFYRSKDLRRAEARNQFMERRFSESLLDTLTLASGGRYFPFDVSFRAENIRDALISMEEEQRHQYYLGYISSQAEKDGLWRGVEVNAGGEQELLVRSRLGYFARGQSLTAIQEMQNLFGDTEGGSEPAGENPVGPPP
jgi:VWFA-related protein